MANHLEQLIAEWLVYKGYFVRSNVRVGKLSHGGYEGELDIVAYHPVENHLIHIESSMDALTWKNREERFTRKFSAGRKYIIPEIFPWLPHNKQFDQWAVLWASDMNHQEVGGGKVVPIWKIYNLIAQDVIKTGNTGKIAISEQSHLLRTMQYTIHWVKPEKADNLKLDRK